jgi:hypothetical protein
MVLVALALAAGVFGCGSSRSPWQVRPGQVTASHRAGAGSMPEVPVPGRIPPLLEADNVYAAERPGYLSPTVRGDPGLVYVPNSESNTVDVISQRTFKIVERFPVGALPQHVTPSWDLHTLYVTNDNGNSLTPIDPRNARPGTPIAVADPYNMYFTADGRYAVIVAERLRRLDFRDAHTTRRCTPSKSSCWRTGPIS